MCIFYQKSFGHDISPSSLWLLTECFGYCQVLLKICPGMSDWKLWGAEHIWIGTYLRASLEAEIWKFGHRDTHYLETRRQPASTQNYWYELSCHSSQMAFMWRFIVFHTSPMFLALYNKWKKETWSLPLFFLEVCIWNSMSYSGMSTWLCCLLPENTSKFFILFLFLNLLQEHNFQGYTIFLNWTAI